MQVTQVLQDEDMVKLRTVSTELTYSSETTVIKQIQQGNQDKIYTYSYIDTVLRKSRLQLNAIAAFLPSPWCCLIGLAPPQQTTSVTVPDLSLP